MPKKGFGMYKADVSIKFYPPIYTHDKTDAEIMNEAETHLLHEETALLYQEMVYGKALF